MCDEKMCDLLDFVIIYLRNYAEFFEHLRAYA
jgi:hypothetical protein